jgi:hypothetical protein
MMKLNTIILGAGALCLCGMGALTGCQRMDPLSYKSIRSDPTPELQGTGERPVDINRHLAVVDNLNMRMASDDLGRIWYTNSPSYLSPMPVTTLSGVPR